MKSNDQVVADQTGSARSAVLLAFVWLIGFSIWFHHFELPNNQVPRLLLWESILSFDLLDFFDPQDQPGSAPWSWYFLGQRIPFLGIAIGIWIAAWAIGSLVLRLVGLKLHGYEHHFFAICLGLSITSLATLALGLSGCLWRWLLIAVLAVPCVVEAILCRRDPISIDFGKADGKSRQTLLVRSGLMLAICLAPFVIGLLLGAMSPQTDYDVVEYHLAGPKEWFQRGQIVRLPHNVYTSFPCLSEMLVLSGMVLYGDWQWGALAGQAVLAGFAPLTALGLFAAGRRWFSEGAGWVASLVYLTSPWTYRISIIAYAEGGLSCYLFAALYAFLMFRDRIVDSEPEVAKQSSRIAILAGLLSGSAMACKYTGLVSVVIPVAMLLIGMAFRHSRTARIRHMALTACAFALGVCITVGPWLLKNTVETGNPVYPLAVRIFGGIDRDPDIDARWVHGHAAKSYDSWRDRLKDLPVKLTDVAAKNDWHSPLMFALAPLTVFWCFRRRARVPASVRSPQRAVLAITWFYVAWQFFTWWILTHQIDRFYVPMFSAVALVAGAGACWCESGLINSKRDRAVLVWKWGLGIMIAASMLYNAELMMHVRISGFNAGRLDLKVARDIASTTTPSVKWLNEEYEAGRLPPDAKVLCVGDAQMFHARYPYLYNTVFDHSLLEKICADPDSHKMKSAEEIRAEFRRLGLTLIEVDWGEIARFREPGNYGFTEFVTPHLFEELQRMGLLGPPQRLLPSLTFASLDDAQKTRLMEWAPELITTYEGKPAFIKTQIFQVLDGVNAK